MPHYLAHVRRNEDGSFAIHHLEDQLRTVGGEGDECVRVGQIDTMSYVTYSHRWSEQPGERVRGR